jgi:hypothetical protein
VRWQEPGAYQDPVSLRSGAEGETLPLKCIFIFIYLYTVVATRKVVDVACFGRVFAIDYQ